MTHPLLKFSQEAVEKFDLKKFRDNLIMATAVAISLHFLKVTWNKANEARKNKKV